MLLNHQILHDAAVPPEPVYVVAPSANFTVPALGNKLVQSVFCESVDEPPVSDPANLISPPHRLKI